MGAEAPGRLRILVVDDDRFSRELIREQLAALGYACETAPDGEEALARLGAAAYDLLICDFRMPHLDGPALARAVRARDSDPARLGRSVHRPHIAIISANADLDHASACLAAGVDDFLPKPVAFDVIEALVARVASAISGARGAQATLADGVKSVSRAEAVLDPSALTRIYRNPQRVSAVLTGWLAAVERDLAELRAALERADVPTVGDIAHRLRGSASVTGAMRLSDVAARLEIAAEDAGGPVVATVSELSEAFAEVRAAVDAFTRKLN